MDQNAADSLQPPPEQPVASPRVQSRVRPFFRALLFIMVFIPAVIFLSKLLREFGHFLPIPRGWREPSAVLLVNALVLLLSFAMLRLFDNKSFQTLGLWFYPGWTKEAAAGIAIAIGLMLITVGLVVAPGWVRYESASVFPATPAMAQAAIFILLAAAFEEFMFRGYVFQRLVESLGANWAILVTSAFFGILHLNNPNSPGWLSTVNTMLAGVLLALAYLKTRGLWMPIGIHWAWNFFLGPIFSSPISGTTEWPMIFRVTLHGSRWQTGGTYGYEASATLTVACALAIFWLWKTKSIGTTPAMLDVSKDSESA